MYTLVKVVVLCSDSSFIKTSHLVLGRPNIIISA